jgi:DNA-binding IclR family transcriptional regulator
MSPRATRQQGIQSIEIGARLLQALTQTARPQMLKDLAAVAQMPPAKAHRYLVSFMRMGLVEQQTETGLYDLGPFALELGLGALARLDPVTAAAPALVRLCEQTGQTTALAVWANRGATIVRWVGADTPVAAGLRVGSVMPLTRSATGLAFASFLSASATRKLVREELAHNKRDGLAPATAGDLEPLVAATRRNKVARTSEFIAGISGAAAPVFDHAGNMVIALICLGYTRPFEADQKKIVAALEREAAQVSARLGFAPGQHPS